MMLEYDEESDETNVKMDGETLFKVNGKINRWKKGLPHPETEAYDDFEDGLLKLSSPKERRVLLHVMTGKIERKEDA